MAQIIRPFAEEIAYREEQAAKLRIVRSEDAEARALEAKLRNEAISVAHTMATPGWKHIESLLAAALQEVTEAALRPAKSTDKATVRLLQAQGAVAIVSKFKAALELARKENNAS